MNQQNSGIFTNLVLASNDPENVSFLDLTHTQYEQLPEDIKKFRNLRSLLLPTLIEPIPRWVSELNDLQHLEIIKHNFEHIPDQLMELKGLKFLRLGENFDGNGIQRIEDNLLMCPTLQKLEIDFNPIEYIANGLSDHPNLKTVNLNGEREGKLDYFPKWKRLNHLELEDFLMERIPSGLEYCTELISLSLSHNKLKSIDLTPFKELKELLLNTNKIHKINADHPLEKLERLELGSNGLNLFPGKISNFISLQEIDLSHNDLVTLPDEICQLKNLRKINLRNNELRDLPLEWGQILSLEWVNLSQNQLRDLPNTTRDLVNLQYMDLSQNKLLRLPPYMDAFSDLKYLDLSMNQLFSQSYSMPENLGNLQHLETLNLSNNQLESIPDCLTKIPLQKLDLSNNSVSFLPEEMSKWNGLKYLYLQNNPVIKITSGVEQLGALEHLNLDHVSIMNWDENLEQLSKLPQLKSLSLRYNGIKTLLPYLDYLNHLTMVDIRRNAIVDEEKELIQQQLGEHCTVYV